MSDQRRLRAEMRQGLHQFIMHMYQSYLESNSEEKAKELVAECIKEQLSFFTSLEATPEGISSFFNQKISELDALLKECQGDFDKQMYYAEKIDTLQEALTILQNS